MIRITKIFFITIFLIINANICFSIDGKYKEHDNVYLEVISSVNSIHFRYDLFMLKSGKRARVLPLV